MFSKRRICLFCFVLLACLFSFPLQLWLQLLLSACWTVSVCVCVTACAVCFLPCTLLLPLRAAVLHKFQLEMRHVGFSSCHGGQAEALNVTASSKRLLASDVGFLFFFPSRACTRDQLQDEERRRKQQLEEIRKREAEERAKQDEERRRRGEEERARWEAEGKVSLSVCPSVPAGSNTLYQSTHFLQCYFF